MDLLIIVSIFIAVGAVAAGVIYWSIQQEKLRREAIEAHGWSYAKSGGGFRIEGISDGMVWEYKLVVKRGGSANSTGNRRSATWSTAAEPSDEILLLGPQLPAAMLQMGFSGMLVQFLAKMVLGDKAEDLARARELNVPGPLKGKMSVVGTDQAFADAFLTEPVVQALAALETSKPPAILRWKDSLEIRVLDAPGSIATIEAAVALGEVLATSIGYGDPEG